MLVLYTKALLRAEWCRSLKDKRAAVKPLLHKLRSTFNVSAAETGHQDSHTLFEIGLAMLAFDAAQADSMAESLYAFILGNTDAELLEWSAEYR